MCILVDSCVFLGGMHVCREHFFTEMNEIIRPSGPAEYVQHETIRGNRIDLRGPGSDNGRR